ASRSLRRPRRISISVFGKYASGEQATGDSKTDRLLTIIYTDPARTNAAPIPKVGSFSQPPLGLQTGACDGSLAAKQLRKFGCCEHELSGADGAQIPGIRTLLTWRTRCACPVNEIEMATRHPADTTRYRRYRAHVTVGLSDTYEPVYIVSSYTVGQIASTTIKGKHSLTLCIDCSNSADFYAEQGCIGRKPGTVHVPDMSRNIAGLKQASALGYYWYIGRRRDNPIEREAIQQNAHCAYGLVR
ncbi:hypothetical protein FOMPIDRAFT_1021022, partial [Fomitopsis schrenkii]